MLQTDELVLLSHLTLWLRGGSYEPDPAKGLIFDGALREHLFGDRQRVLPLMPIFNTYHGMPLRTVQGVHEHQVEAIIFLVKVMLTREDLLGKFLAVNQACKVYKLADFGRATKSILSELT